MTRPNWTSYDLQEENSASPLTQFERALKYLIHNRAKRPVTNHCISFLCRAFQTKVVQTAQRFVFFRALVYIACRIR